MPTGDLFDVGIKVLAGLLPVVGGLAIWAVTKYVRLLHVEKDLRMEKDARAAAEAKLAETRDANEAARKSLVAELEKKRAQYNEAREVFYRLKAAYLDLKQNKAVAAEGDLADAVRERDAAERRFVEARREADELQGRLDEITRFDGRLWLRPPRGPVPAFRPLAERKAVVIAVLNLKGGVGKTTLTANLAATLAAAGRPALLLDLDYQRSLSMMLLADKDRIVRHRGGRSVQHFLGGPEHTLGRLLRMTEDKAEPVPRCCLIANSDPAATTEDGLDDVETRLMIEWLADPAKPDPRFFLRAALHDPGLGAHFGYVFLDCPPRLTTACVNALAAADYVLVPVVPDAVSTHAAENLLRTLGRYKTDLLPDLSVLGVVPNMVRLLKGQPINAHKDALTELKGALEAVWPEPVKVTDAVIKHDTAFGQAAAELDMTGEVRLAIGDDDLKTAFRALARELEKDIDRYARRRTPPVPDQSAAGARSGG